MAMTLELSHQPMHPIFIPWCAGTSRHERLVRKHVPDSDPGCALQSTSMPALHRRNLPNWRPMADARMRKCSAGACPPLGLGVGRSRIRRANSLYQATTPAFHTVVCRRQPAWAIAMKACPGLRSGMCPPINLDAGSPPAKPAELETHGRCQNEKM